METLQTRPGLAETENDARFTMGLLADVLDVLDRHGYQRAGARHTGKTMGLLLTLVRAYEGRDDDGQVRA